ncbi:hypothetical protein OQX61_24205 [Pedobacter sp. PLR]|nr:hypothetical protein [Pedobacter sp. PLR]MCX2454388.1 hypothetical protein [Pedobacter sp. PLR]
MTDAKRSERSIVTKKIKATKRNKMIEAEVLNADCPTESNDKNQNH